MNFKITANQPLSTLVRNNNLLSWKDIVCHIQNLPYGRNANRYDLSLVIKEQKGSCSSKHAFLAELARENNIQNISLILGIYKMNSENTNIGKTLENSGLHYIPEAHCYLKINQQRHDITTTNASFEKLKDVILTEKTIQPKQVSEFKVNYHKQFIKDWIIKENIPVSFEEVWKFREQCIAFLSKN